LPSLRGVGMSIPATEPGPSRLELRHVTKHYSLRGRTNHGRVVHAVDDVSLELPPGATVAIVGESGCGKSTLAKCVVGTTPVTSGEILIEGTLLADEEQWRRNRRRIQFVSQNPLSALNRRRTIGDSLAQALRTHDIVSGRSAVAGRVSELLDLVGLPAAFAVRFPSGVSGGEMQRVAIARALSVEPSVLVLDEPTSSLDVSVKGLIINLLQDLQRELGLSYLMITHEIDVARYMADTVAVMYLGHLVESARIDDDLHLAHPYSQLLFGSHAAPDPDHPTTAVRITGEVPSAIAPPSGCRFHTRCPVAIDICRTELPVLEREGVAHLVACHRAGEGLDVARQLGGRAAS
jgi:oligopeptide/dipeptide ABC transporter ATP-binding protein